MRIYRRAEMVGNRADWGNLYVVVGFMDGKLVDCDPRVWQSVAAASTVLAQIKSMRKQLDELGSDKPRVEYEIVTLSEVPERLLPDHARDGNPTVMGR